MPSVAIIVPTRDRLAPLTACLESLRHLNYPPDRIEIVVVNDGGAAPVIRASEPDEPRVTIIATAQAGPASARNAGVEATAAEILAFIDDDCVADAGWLEALVGSLGDRPGVVAGGRVVNGLPANRYSRASQGLIDYLYAYYHEQGRGLTPFFTTNNMAILRDTFERVGPFDASFPFASEDRDWCDRCRGVRVPLVYVAGAIVHHLHDLGPLSFLRQHFRYGRGARRFHAARALRGAGRMRLEAPDFYMGMLRAPVVAADPEPVRAAALLALSQVVGALGWLCERYQPERPP